MGNRVASRRHAETRTCCVMIRSAAALHVRSRISRRRDRIAIRLRDGSATACKLECRQYAAMDSPLRIRATGLHKHSRDDAATGDPDAHGLSRRPNVPAQRPAAVIWMLALYPSPDRSAGCRRHGPSLFLDTTVLDKGSETSRARDSTRQFVYRARSASRCPSTIRPDHFHAGTLDATSSRKPLGAA